ncbi:sodium-dependent proline transporter-like [Dermacentor variabilis]|uniref:sodium-dependent proline transporter-like n=1 Tax=Dermacentor variabilis TaxID=34621 RepID=UPI003F5B5E04
MPRSPPDVVMSARVTAREKWSSHMEFLCSCIGNSVGLGNLWRFPYVAYKNGGAAFLVPYIAINMFVGRPIYYLELLLGQFSSSGPLGAFRLSPMFQASYSGDCNNRATIVDKRMALIDRLQMLSFRFKLFSVQLPSSYTSLKPPGNAFGMMWGAFITTIYYQVVLTYAFLYLYHSFKRPLPWTDCFEWWGTTLDGCFRRTREDGTGQRLCDNIRRNLVSPGLNDTSADHLVVVSYMNRTVLVSQNEYAARFAGCINANASSTDAFYNNYVLNVSPSIEETGEIQQPLLICYGLCWTLIFLAIFKGIQVSGKVALLTATAPYFMLSVMLLRGITLPGATIGLRYLLLPRWEALLDGRVWAAATEQVFYSLSIGTGGLVLYGSFQEFRADMQGSVRIICIMDFLTSAFASLVIFSVLGNLAHTLDVPIEEVVSAGPGLAFVTYPEALSLLTFPNLWAVLFFTMLFMLGIDSQMANCEFVIKSIQDLFPPLEGRREVATFLYCVSCFLIGLPLTTRAGLYILTILDNYLGALIVLFTCFGETLIVAWVYGMDRFCFDVAFMTGRCPSYYFLAAIKYVSPVVLGTFLVYTLATLPRSTVGDYVLPVWADGYGWLLAIVGMAAVVVIAVARIVQCGGDWWRALSPDADWGPYETKYRARYFDQLEKSGIGACYYPVADDARYIGGAVRSPAGPNIAIN